MEGHQKKQEMSLKLMEALGPASAAVQEQHDQGSNPEFAQTEPSARSPGSHDEVLTRSYTDHQATQEYCIRVLTSDKLGAGTDAKVHIVLEDDTGKRSALVPGG